MKYKNLISRLDKLNPPPVGEVTIECIWGTYEYEKECREREGRSFITEEGYNHMRAAALNAGAGDWEPVAH